MKSVVISSSLLGFSILIIFLNTICVSAITEKMLIELDTLPDDIPPSQYEEGIGGEKLDYLISYFNKNEFFISLSTNLEEIQAVKSALLSMREFYNNGNQAHYLASRAVFAMYVERWHMNEFPHADNIL